MFVLNYNHVLLLNFIFKLLNLVSCDFKFSFKLGNFILSFKHELRIKVSIGSYSFIKILLLLELSFIFDIFLFKFSDHILFKLDLFNHLHKTCVCFSGFLLEFVSLLFNLRCSLHHLLEMLLVGSQLLFDCLFFIFEQLYLHLVGLVVTLYLFDVFDHLVTITHQAIDVRKLLDSGFLKPFDFSSQC